MKRGPSPGVCAGASGGHGVLAPANHVGSPPGRTGPAPAAERYAGCRCRLPPPFCKRTRVVRRGFLAPTLTPHSPAADGLEEQRWPGASFSPSGGGTQGCDADALCEGASEERSHPPTTCLAPHAGPLCDTPPRRLGPQRQLPQHPPSSHVRTAEGGRLGRATHCNLLYSGRHAHAQATVGTQGAGGLWSWRAGELAATGRRHPT